MLQSMLVHSFIAAALMLHPRATRLTGRAYMEDAFAEAKAAAPKPAQQTLAQKSAEQIGEPSLATKASTVKAQAEETAIAAMQLAKAEAQAAVAHAGAAEAAAAQAAVAQSVVDAQDSNQAVSESLTSQSTKDVSVAAEASGTASGESKTVAQVDAEFESTLGLIGEARAVAQASLEPFTTFTARQDVTSFCLALGMVVVAVMVAAVAHYLRSAPKSKASPELTLNNMMVYTRHLQVPAMRPAPSAPCRLAMR